MKFAGEQNSVDKTLGREPDPLSPAVRGFNDGRIIPYSNLAEIRRAMTGDDRLLIAAISARRIDSYYSKPAENQEESVRNLIGELVRDRCPEQRGLDSLIEQVYGVIAAPNSAMSVYDIPIVDTIAARVQKSMFATAFKLDRAEGLAPEQQAKNQAKAVQIASNERPGHINPIDSDLPDVINRAYEILVPGTVALQQEVFANTFLIAERDADWDGIGFRGVNLAA